MAFRGGSDANHKGRTPPPDDTHQEANYLKALGEKQRPVRIKLMGRGSARLDRVLRSPYGTAHTRRRAQSFHLQARNRLHRGRHYSESAPRRRSCVPDRHNAEWPGMSRYLAELEPIAREAGVLLMRYFTQRVTIEYKGDVDLVTVADRASEKLIVERLQSRWPEHGIVGEEGTRSEIDADYRWYVDPLDGTTNFAHGYPVFCISIALARRDGQLEAGVLYDPTRDEMFAAERGAGAVMNGKPIQVSKTT